MAILRQIHAIDLFCGAGGLTHGLRRSGVNVALGVDSDPACEFSFTKNNTAEFLLKPVQKLTADDLLPYLVTRHVRLIAGCAPCQTFSSYNHKATELDQRWWLLKEFWRVVNALSPELITMENVPRLVNQNIFREFVVQLINFGYHINSNQIVNCSDYGLPQRRKRLVLVGSKIAPIELLKPSKFGRMRRSVRHAIGRLPPLEAGEQNDDDALHQCASLTPTNLARIRASRPGGTWREWPEELLVECHKRNSGKTYPSVYGRMLWDEPSPTITTQFYGYGNGRFGHPQQDRALSLREGAILQSFPFDYRFVPASGKIQRTEIGRLIGNAVPVTLGEVIGKTFVNHIRQNVPA